MSQSVEIHSRVVGQGGRKVVFLHGLMGQGKNFTTIAKALELDYSSLLVDLPNHGRSGWTDEFSYVEMAELVAADLAGGFAADGPIDLVGHSLGGKVAMVLALRHPELIRRLVIVDIAPAASNGVDDFVHLLGSLSALDLAALTSRGEADEQLAEDIPKASVRGFLLQNLQRGADGWQWRPNLDLLRNSLSEIGGFPEIGATNDGPVLWLAGGDSPYIKPEHTPAMRALFPSTVKATIKGAGHWVHSEQPEAFVNALRTFLKD